MVLKMSKYLNWNVAKIIQDAEIIEKLQNNNVLLVKDLWSLKRRDLKEMSFDSKEINDVIIALQLCGLDLDRKTFY